MSKPTIIKDSAWAIISQSISMITGVVISFVLPKFITVEAFGYWQLFLLYASYVGLLHFGVGDGIYLKLGGQYFDKLDKGELYPQIHLVSLSQIVFALICFLYAILFVPDETRQFIFYALGVFIIVENIYKILSFVLMATDKMIYNSKTVIIDKVLMLLSVLMLICFIDSPNAKYIISAFVLSHLVVLFVVLHKFKGILRINYIFNSDNLKSVIGLASVGIVLTFSNVLSTLIVGSCRMIVEKFWDITTFAQLSFAITISVFVLTFVSQISYVLFPYLRRMTTENQRNVLNDSNWLLTLCSPYLYVFVFPLYFFIILWLPKYAEAAHYMTLIAPICFYEMRTSLLFNTFFKNLEKIRALLILNILTVFLALILYFISVVLHDMEYMTISILISIIFKTMIMQVYLFKYYDLSIDYIYYWDILFTVVMTLTFLLGGLSLALMIYIILVASYSTLLYCKSRQKILLLINTYRRKK